MSNASHMHELRPLGKPTQNWLWTMAWRDSRKSRGRLLLFMASIILGIASLVAINSFGDNLARDIDNEAKTLIGADLVLSRRATPDDSVKALVSSFSGEKAEEKSFASMIFFPKTEDSRLIQVRAVEGPFPFYGEILTVPVEAAATFRNANRQNLPLALVDQSLLLQFNAQVGDSIRVGNGMYKIEGSLLQAPGQSGIAATAAPVVYIPARSLSGTGLIRMGSRITYKFYYKFPAGTDVSALVNEREEELNALSIGSETIEDRKKSLGNAFRDLTSFLNLVAFVALLLGCVGVASAVHVYMRDKIVSIATLRCLGVSGRQAFLIFVCQVAAIGLIGSIIGAVVGSFLQYSLPLVLKDFIPFDTTITLSLPSILSGILTGFFISILFSLPPLIRIRKISPLNALRLEDNLPVFTWDLPMILVSALILAFIILFAWVQTGFFTRALAFTGGVALSFLLLVGVSLLVMRAVRKFFPSGWSYLWRQSLANLYRPNNQTLILIVSIGLGTSLISTLSLTQDMVLEQVNISGGNDRPNLVLFDIQTDQREAIRAIVDEYELPVKQDVPVVTARLHGLHGMNRVEMLADTLKDIPN
ncbi:MAG: FtsX-like permease family protein, partial [Bacteroidota bacterium]